MTTTRNELKEVLAVYKGERQELVHILQHIQKKWGYLPQETMREVSRFLHIPESSVYSVATFYSQFKFVRQGRHSVRVCLGTACHVRGGPRILETVEQQLGIQSGGTSPDYKYSLEKVNCLGCCALGPVLVVDENYHGKVSPADVSGILASYD
jgi:NADH-quinone oxidoreductase subunit E